VSSDGDLTSHSHIPRTVPSLVEHYQKQMGQWLSSPYREGALQTLIFYLELTQDIETVVFCLRGALDLLYKYRLSSDQETARYARARVNVYEGFLKEVGVL